MPSPKVLRDRSVPLKLTSSSSASAGHVVLCIIALSKETTRDRSVLLKSTFDRLTWSRTAPDRDASFRIASFRFAFLRSALVKIRADQIEASASPARKSRIRPVERPVAGVQGGGVLVGVGVIVGV